MDTKDFESRFMALISGQQMLPQHVFRSFLGWLEENVPAVDVSGKQDKEDDSLATTDKTIVGAIGEVKTTADGAASKANAALPASAIVYDNEGHLVIEVGGVKYQVAATPIVEEG